MGIVLKWNGSPKAILDRKFLKGGRTALFAAVTWQRLVNPHVPMDTGLLANGAVEAFASPDGRAGLVRYGAPYAAFCYYGEGRSFSPSKHPLASARWDMAARDAGKARALAADVRRFVASGR